MSSYFDRVEQGMREAVERRAHRPWYRRVLQMSRTRTLVVMLAALVVATPAVAAVSGWFSFGKPNVPAPAKPGYLWGLEKPGSSRLLPLRVSDPEGGPAWGLRIVQTSRDDTCVQLGRVEDGQLGSLGIDDAWHNDGQFHVISPKDDGDDQCGSTDATGYGYVNRGILGEQASANVQHQGQGSGSTSSGCRLPQYLSLIGPIRRHPGLPTRVSTTPACSAGAGRVVFFGLLGPDAVSVTYRKPGGGLATERTSGDVGAYLLVFPYTEATCDQYSHYKYGSVSCGGISMGGASPSLPGAVVKITYKGGHSCSLVPSAKLEAAYSAFQRMGLAELGEPPHVRIRSGDSKLPAAYAKWLAKYRKLLDSFLAKEHLTLTQLRNDVGPLKSCPAVGWVSAKQPKVTAAEVATRIIVRKYPTGDYGCPTKLHLPDGCSGGGGPTPSRMVPVEWSFKARRAVTNSRSWYEWSVSSPTGHGCVGGGSSFSTYTNVSKGQMLRYSQLFPASCHGTYEIVVGYVASAPSGQQDNGGGGTPGHDGSIIVGRASFTIR